MVKYCLDKYPMGSFPHQRTTGKYMDGTLYENLQLLAKKIVDDMTFLMFLFSSTLEVGTGKSVFAQQIAEAINEMVNKFHGLNTPFSVNNIVFHPKDLIERAFQIPKYSIVILDEWEDAHYWSELGITLRQFFRKCRQLNLFMIVIIPNFFELPKGYAISRSVLAIDVKFQEGFERGFFDFYSFKRKKELYLKGKKDYNYDVTKADFIGRFPDGYAVGREVYLRHKRLDLAKHDKEDKKNMTASELTAKNIRDMKERTGKTNVEIGKLWGCNESWVRKCILKGDNPSFTRNTPLAHAQSPILINNLVKGDNVMGEEEKAEEMKVEKIEVDGVDQIAPHTNRQVVEG